MCSPPSCECSPELTPYLTIAQEIYDYDNTNYPGIPPANPGGVAPPDDGSYAATSCTMVPSPPPNTPPNTPITLTVVSSAGFKVGYCAIIDSWDAVSYEATGKQRQETQVTSSPWLKPGVSHPWAVYLHTADNYHRLSRPTFTGAKRPR